MNDKVMDELKIIKKELRRIRKQIRKIWKYIDDLETWLYHTFEVNDMEVP